MRLPPLLARAPLLVALVSSLPTRVARADTPAQPVLPVESFRLANGLRVLLAPDADARLVTVMTSYGVGAADDPGGMRGLAHLTEHLVFEETEHVGSAFYALEAAGASRFGASTTHDETHYFASIPPERLEMLLWLESDRMAYAANAVTDARVDAERATLSNEEAQRGTDTPLRDVSTFIARELYPEGHPYARPVADWLPDRVHAQDVRDFIHSWYTPANATLVIAGRCDRDRTVAAVARYFGSLRGSPPPERREAHGASDFRPYAAELTIAAAVTNDEVFVSWRAPAFGGKDDAALDLAAELLAGPGNERLTRALVGTRGVAGVTAHERSERLASVFTVRARVSPNVTAKRVADAILVAAGQLGRSAGEAEVARAREIRRHELLLGLETPGGRALALASLHGIGVEPGPGFDWGLGRYDALSADDVAHAVATWLDAHPIVSLVHVDPRAPRQGIERDAKRAP